MSKVKKEKTEKRANRPRFNVLDAVIILLVIAAVVGVYFRYSILDFLTSDRNSQKYVVSYSIDNMRATTSDYFIVGDKVYFDSDGELFGTLLSESQNKEPLSEGPAYESFADSKGEVHKVPYPDMNNRVSAKGRLLCEGKYNENGGFSVDGKSFVAPGQQIKVYTERVSFTLTVTSVEPYTEDIEQ